MQLKLYQLPIAAGTLSVFLLQIIRHGPPASSDTAESAMLEAAGFGLCCLGVATGGRSIRATYEALGSSKAAAIRDKAYMRERRSMQVAAAIASVAIASLLASRYGLSPLYTAIICSAGIALLIPLMNRMTGWSRTPNSSS